jgi:hypothetical protein
VEFIAEINKKIILVQWKPEYPEKNKARQTTLYVPAIFSSIFFAQNEKQMKKMINLFMETAERKNYCISICDIDFSVSVLISFIFVFLPSKNFFKCKEI